METPQIAFPTEEAAREYAREHHKTDEIMVLHSAHNFNPKNENGERWDYFIEPSDTFVRSWEKVLFTGKGKNA